MAPPLTKICPAALRLMVMVASPSSSNTDSKPALGENLALIAMVVVLSKVWPRRRCALALNGGRTYWRTHAPGYGVRRIGKMTVPHYKSVSVFGNRVTSVTSRGTQAARQRRSQLGADRSITPRTASVRLSVSTPRSASSLWNAFLSRAVRNMTPRTAECSSIATTASFRSDANASCSASRAPVVYRPAANDNDLGLMRRIDELFTAWPFLGSRRIDGVDRQALRLLRVAHIRSRAGLFQEHVDRRVGNAQFPTGTGLVAAVPGRGAAGCSHADDRLRLGERT